MRFAGRYEFGNNNLWTLVARDGKLCTLSDGLIDDELVPAAPGSYRTVDGAVELSFTEAEDGAPAFSWRRGGKSGTAPRVGPCSRVAAWVKQRASWMPASRPRRLPLTWPS